MAKNLFDVMALRACEELNEKNLMVTGATLGEAKQKDANGKETGVISKFLRLDIIVPRKNGCYSNISFSVKIPDGKLKFDATVLNSDEEEIFVTFNDLTISFIDAKKNVYFKASDYEVVEEQIDI